MTTRIVIEDAHGPRPEPGEIVSMASLMPAIETIEYTFEYPDPRDIRVDDMILIPNGDGSYAVVHVSSRQWTLCRDCSDGDLTIFAHRVARTAGPAEHDVAAAIADVEEMLADADDTAR